MKKFTNIGNENVSINENDISTKRTIDKLLETLSLEIEGSDDEITIDYKIKANNKFYEGIKNVIDTLYNKEKIALLEKARMNHLLNNISWIDDEIENINENNKK